ncbi:MAG: RNA polymerase sigma factor [Bryobacterales bacterium]|nr:RNA polymerase sigma factor [Bryobacterales bacterium]
MRSAPLSDDDSELIAQVKADPLRSDAAFEKLVDRHHSMVYTLCLRLSGSRADAEDLMQEVFIRAYVNINGFEGRSAFSSWLYRIAYNHCLNFLEKRRTAQASENAFAIDQVGDHPSTERNDAVLQTLARLPPDQRSILIFKYVMGLELEEIADAMSTSVGAVKMRLLRARESFRRHHQAPGAPTKKAAP